MIVVSFYLTENAIKMRSSNLQSTIKLVYFCHLAALVVVRSFEL
jgi:hypothetical protein